MNANVKKAVMSVGLILVVMAGVKLAKNNSMTANITNKVL